MKKLRMGINYLAIMTRKTHQRDISLVSQINGIGSGRRYGHDTPDTGYC